MAISKAIRHLYVWIATEKDGSEGVPATSMELDGDPYIVPLLGSGQARLLEHPERRTMRGFHVHCALGSLR